MSPNATIDALAARLRPHYSRFLGGLNGDILMTAHSHQAWPDVSRAAQLQAWDDAASLVDQKWAKVFSEIIPKFQNHVAHRIGSHRPSDIAIAGSTHELVNRLLSCFPLQSKILTSTAEFHSLRRQLTRLTEDGAAITWIDAQSPAFCDRFCEAIIAEKPDLIALSYVFFTNAEILIDLPQILALAAEKDIPVLVDLYHGFNTVEISVDEWPGQIFVVGGGYKYAQSGEGVCWMSLPQDAADFRPRNTGWFADFEHLESEVDAIQYGPGGQRFLGATFDPTALYRANAVMDWMDHMNLDVKTLRAQASRQTSLLLERFDAIGLEDSGFSLASPRKASKRASFLSLRHPDAALICQDLLKAGLRTDARNDLLRFGPGPYTTSAECCRAMEILQRRAV
jgi:kynureninase